MHGDEAAGSVSGKDLGTRFGFIRAPRSTVVQPGPVHGGLTGDPAAELARLLVTLVRSSAATNCPECGMYSGGRGGLASITRCISGSAAPVAMGTSHAGEEAIPNTRRHPRCPTLRGTDLGLAKLQLEALHVVAQQQGIEVGNVQIDPGIFLGVPPVVVARPRDLLRLRFSFDNLRLSTVDGQLVLARGRANAQARLVVDHQPQHLVEEAGYEALDDNDLPKFEKPLRPVQTRLSTHSRLVFSVGSAQIPWTLEGLLDACATLPLLLAPNAQIDPKLRDVVVLGPAHGGLLTAQAALAKVKLTAESAPGVAATLGTLQRTMQAARVIEARAGSSGAVTSLAGMPLSDRLGLQEIGEGISVLKVRPEPHAPTEFQTSLEIPWRLKLSPGPTGAWVHQTDPVDHGGRVELWHSRLGRRRAPGPTRWCVRATPTCARSGPATSTSSRRRWSSPRTWPSRGSCRRPTRATPTSRSSGRASAPRPG